MILAEEETRARLESPLNLLNRLRAETASASRNSRNHTNSPLLPPTSDELVDDLTDKLNQSTIKSKAQSIMIAAMEELSNRVTEVSKPEQLARVAESMSKIVESQTVKDKQVKTATVVIYSPQIMQESEFEVIDISARE